MFEVKFQIFHLNIYRGKTAKTQNFCIYALAVIIRNHSQSAFITALLKCQQALKAPPSGN